MRLAIEQTLNNQTKLIQYNNDNSETVLLVDTLANCLSLFKNLVADKIRTTKYAYDDQSSNVNDYVKNTTLPANQILNL